MDNQKVAALVRLAVPLYALVNATLLALGINPLPFSEEEVSTAVTALIGFVGTVYAWWKNTPMTKEAQQAQEVLDELKRKK